MEQREPHGLDVALIYDDIEIVEGEKGMFGAVARTVRKAEKLSVETLTQNISGFCREFGARLSEIDSQLGNYSLEKVELDIGLGAKGEIRLFGVVAGELKGSIKLVFSRSSVI